MSGLFLLPFLGFGALILAIPVLVLVLLILTLTLRSRLRAQEARLAAVEAELRALRLPTVTAPTVPAPSASPTPHEASPEVGPAQAPPSPEAISQAPASLVVEPRPPAAPPPPASTVPMPETRGGGAGWSHLEGVLGGRWLSRVGALVLVLGIGFSLKYAFENDWIGPTGRVAIGFLAGIGLLLLGERLGRAAYRVPAQGLVVTGIATLYLSAYAAHGFYHLIELPAALAIMTLVAATGMAVAIHHDARAIATLASVGGFLTPIILSTGTDAAIGLFSYLAILDAGVLASTYWRRWPELAGLSFVFTHYLYWSWFTRWYQPASLRVAFVAASVFFILFALVGPLRAAGAQRTARPSRAGRAPAVLILATPTAYFLTARAILAPDRRAWLALLCLALATAYLCAGRWALGGLRDRTSLALPHFAVALAFLTLAFAVWLTEYSLAIAWSVEGAALSWGGLRRRLPKLRAGALVILTLAWARLYTMTIAVPGHGGAFLLGHPALPATVVFVSAAAAAAALYRRHEAELLGPGRWETLARPLLILAAFGSLALLLTAELSQLQPLGLPSPLARVFATGVWTLTALPLLALARGDRTRILLAAVTVLLAAVGVLAAGDADAWSTLPGALRPAALNPRFFGGLLIVVLYGLYARVVPEFPLVGERNRLRLGAVSAAATALFLLWHLSVEVMLLPLEGSEATKLRGAGLSVLWALYAFAAMGVGMWGRWASLRIGAIGLFGVTVVKVLLVDLGQLDAGYRVLSFVVLGGVLLLASFVHAKYRRRSAPAEPG